MNKRSIGVLTACFFIVLIAYSIRYSYGVLLPEMLPALSITKAEAGVIYASFFIAYTVFSPLLGLAGDRLNIRLLLTLFTVILGTGTLLMAYASSLVQASLFYTLVGIGSAACWAPVMALAQRWTSDKHRGKTLAYIDIGSALGIIVSSTTMPLVVAAATWRTGWIYLGAAGLAISLMTALLVKNPPNQQPKIPPDPMRRQDRSASQLYLKLIRDYKFWLLGLAYLLTGFAIIIPFTFITTYATRELAFSFQSATRLVTAIGISAVAGKLVLGSLSDKIRRINIMILCALLIGGGSLGMAYSTGIVLIITTVIFGIGYGAVWSMYAASASDYFSKESSGSIVGLWTVYLGIGMTISPIIAGWLADSTGTLTWGFVLAGAGAMVSLLLLLPIYRVKAK